MMKVGIHGLDYNSNTRYQRTRSWMFYYRPVDRQWIPIEVNRLGILLKAEQSAHQETKRLGALELEELKAKWKEENDLKLKEVIDSYMKLNLGKDMNLEGFSK